MTADWVRLKTFSESEKINMSSLRWTIFNRNKNGATDFIRKVGTRIYISPSKYYEWIGKNKMV